MKQLVVYLYIHLLESYAILNPSSLGVPYFALGVKDAGATMAWPEEGQCWVYPGPDWARSSWHCGSHCVGLYLLPFADGVWLSRVSAGRCRQVGRWCADLSDCPKIEQHSWLQTYADPCDVEWLHGDSRGPWELLLVLQIWQRPTSAVVWKEFSPKKEWGTGLASICLSPRTSRARRFLLFTFRQIKWYPRSEPGA